jgi:hypothetical protein
MAEHDRLILATDRCSTCAGTGWTWWSAEVEGHARGKWVVCRSHLGTGRNDQTGAKREMPLHVPADPDRDPPTAETGADRATPEAPGGSIPGAGAAPANGD